ADLAELVAIRSVQGEPAADAPFGREPARALQLMLEKCGRYGFDTDNADWYAGSASLGNAPEKLGILAHLDVVPEGEGWLHDPFTLTADPDSDQLIGRGTSDDKGPAIAALYALRAVKELGIPLKHGVRLIFGTNEENGSEDMAYYMQHREMPPLVFTPDGDYPVITLEKGMIRLRLTADFTDGKSKVVSLKAGEVVNAVPASADAVLCGVTIDQFLATRVKEYPGTVIAAHEDAQGLLHVHVDGRNAHASTPALGKNALTLMLELLSLLPLPGAQGKVLRRLSELYPYGETDGSTPGIAASDGLSGALTLVLSVMEMNEKGMTAWNDIRFPVCCTGAALVQAMQAVLPVDAEAVICDEPHHTDENSDFVQALLRVYEEVTGNPGECLAIGGGTYVHHIEGGVAFGATFPGEDIHMHGAEEYIRKQHLLLDAEMMALAVTELCGA
ncbi:MAG: Sapep family Mn(2+)-dependent dipeptidase, partial [Oscillospiraceae bacterium]|nr:Sapep family Mn(2+)-dependent dipeptidase [Oscillospiraceae bacterium]